jgi:hypothetical protein
LLEKQQVEGYCQPMRMVSSIEIVRERTNRNLLRVNQASKVVLEPLDPAPDPFMEQHHSVQLFSPQAGMHVVKKRNSRVGLQMLRIAKWLQMLLLYLKM